MSIGKLLKRGAKREALKLASKLEMLSAAFLKETGLKATETVLVGKDEPGGIRKYWFEKRIDKVVQSELHPDMRMIFEFATRTLYGPPLNDEENAGFREMMDRYKGAADGEGDSVVDTSNDAKSSGPVGESDSD